MVAPQKGSNSDAADATADSLSEACSSSPSASRSSAAAAARAVAAAAAAQAVSAAEAAAAATVAAAAAATEQTVATTVVAAAPSEPLASLAATAPGGEPAVAAESDCLEPNPAEPLAAAGLGQVETAGLAATAAAAAEHVPAVSVPAGGQLPGPVAEGASSPLQVQPPPEEQVEEEGGEGPLAQSQRGDEGLPTAAAADSESPADSTALVLAGAGGDLVPAASTDDSGTESDEDAPLDDAAVAISVLAAAAAAAAAAEAGAQHPYPYAPRGGTRRHRNTSTWELRPPARRPPRVVAFDGSGGLPELQALISSVNEPTIIDLQGRVITLEPAAAAPPPPPPSPAPAPAPARAARSTALVAPGALSVPGWSSAIDAVSERAKMLGHQRPPSSSAVAAAAVASRRGAPAPPPPPQRQQQRQQATAAGGQLHSQPHLHLNRDDVTLANGTLQLSRDCRLLVTGRRVTLRRVEVVDAEAAAWWRTATAMPATCLQTSALITVAAPSPTDGSPSSPHRHQQPAASSLSSDGPSLELDDCSVVASGRDRDLLRADGGGAAVTARYSRLRGGANAAVATLHSSLSLDCCELEGYASTGLVALGSSVRVVGSRLLGAAGAIAGLQAVAGSNVVAVGCFLRGHASNVECLAESSVELQGCVLSRPDCRYGLTVHPASATSTTSTASPIASTASSSSRAGAARASPPPRAPAPSSSSATTTPASPSPASPCPGGRVRLVDCELAHAVQVGGGGELAMERCTLALKPTPADLPRPPLNITSDPVLAAKLAAAVAATAAAAAAAVKGGGRGGGGGEGERGSAFAGSVAPTGCLRLVGCRVGAGGGEGEAVVVEAAGQAHVHVSGSPGVLIRRLGGGGAGAPEGGQASAAQRSRGPEEASRFPPRWQR